MKYPIPAYISITVSPLQSNSATRIFSVIFPDENMIHVTSNTYLIPLSTCSTQGLLPLNMTALEERNSSLDISESRASLSQPRAPATTLQKFSTPLMTPVHSSLLNARDGSMIRSPCLSHDVGTSDNRCSILSPDIGGSSSLRKCLREFLRLLLVVVAVAMALLDCGRLACVRMHSTPLKST